MNSVQSEIQETEEEKTRAWRESHRKTEAVMEPHASISEAT